MGIKSNVYGVYGVFNITKEKWYVGQSTSVYVRLSEHKSKLSKHIHHNKDLQKDYDNGDIILFLPIETAPNFPISELDIKENLYIDKLVNNGKNGGYNKVSNVVNASPKESILSQYQQAIVVIKEQQEATKIFQEKIKSLENDKEHLIKQNYALNDIVKKLLNI